MFAISICTVDGQQLSVGHTKTIFPIRSLARPISYCMAIEEHGSDKVHSHVGVEPSGKSFNAIELNENNIPHNPLINAGSIMVSSLIDVQSNNADRF